MMSLEGKKAGLARMEYQKLESHSDQPPALSEPDVDANASESKVIVDPRGISDIAEKARQLVRKSTLGENEALFLVCISVTPTVVCANCVMGALLCALMSLAGTLLFALSWSALNPTKHLKKLLERPQRDVSA